MGWGSYVVMMYATPETMAVASAEPVVSFRRGPRESSRAVAPSSPPGPVPQMARVLVNGRLLGAVGVLADGATRSATPEHDARTAGRGAIETQPPHGYPLVPDP